MTPALVLSTPEEQAQKLREQGIPEELIAQLLNLGSHDPSGLTKQYDQSAYLRRAATSGEFAKTGLGVLAQGIAGALAGKADKDYGAAVRNYQGKAADARGSWFRAKYPKTPQITSVPKIPDPEDQYYP
jgi:hypothetical protein